MKSKTCSYLVGEGKVEGGPEREKGGGRDRERGGGRERERALYNQVVLWQIFLTMCL
jgi:hypothetical protein